MALAVGVTADQLADAGRADAAEQITRIENEAQHGSSLVPFPSSGGSGQDADEIELIYASNLSATRRLELIRMVLRLRAQAEIEAAQARDEAPADAEVSVEQQQG
ncbi:MAG: hypothetical protein ABW046_07050 [Actinoplanes sp.]